MTERPPRTEAEERVARELERLVAPGGPFRTVTLVATYRSTPDEGLVSFAHGIAMQGPFQNGALDVVMLERFLRALADRVGRLAKEGPGDTTGVTVMDGPKVSGS